MASAMSVYGELVLPELGNLDQLMMRIGLTEIGER